MLLLAQAEDQVCIFLFANNTFEILIVRAQTFRIHCRQQVCTLVSRVKRVDRKPTVLRIQPFNRSLVLFELINAVPSFGQ